MLPTYSAANVHASARARPLRRLPRPLRDGSARYLKSHRGLLWRITRNELRARYAGSHLGNVWVVLAPALLLVVYAVTYVAILRIRLAGLTPAEYVIFIFSGLVPYLMTAEALSAESTSVLTNKSVLNNTVFPIDLAPVKAVLTAQATMVVGMAATLVGAVAIGTFSWTVVLLPAIWLLNVGVPDRHRLVPVVAQRHLPRHPEPAHAGADGDAGHLPDRLHARDRSRQPQAADPPQPVRVLRASPTSR